MGPDPERGLGDHAEGALRAEEDLVHVWAQGGPGEGLGGQDASGRDAAEGLHHVLDLAVVRGLLARAPGRHPAANGGELEGLGEVAAGVALLVQGSLVGGAIEAGLHAREEVRAVHLQEADQVPREIQAQAAPRRLQGSGHGRSPARGHEGDVVIVAQAHEGHHVILGTRIHHDVRRALHPAETEA